MQTIRTVFGTLSQVFFKRNTAAFVNAAHTCRTPLKLCKQRQISATAVHFSMAATRACILFLRMNYEHKQYRTLSVSWLKFTIPIKLNANKGIWSTAVAHTVI